LPAASLLSSLYSDMAPIVIVVLSLHDALPFCLPAKGASSESELFFLPSCIATRQALLCRRLRRRRARRLRTSASFLPISYGGVRSEEHTSELQSRFDLVCRLLLEKINTRLAKE